MKDLTNGDQHRRKKTKMGFFDCVASSADTFARAKMFVRAKKTVSVSGDKAVARELNNKFRRQSK